MRILSAELLAAQHSAAAAPYLKAVVSDRIGGVKRLAFARLYTGSEPDGYHAAAMPGDGSLIRARVTGGRLYYARVVGPGTLSTYSSWTDLSAAANADVALCADGSRVLLFYVDTGGTLVRVRESTDNGATLGAAVTAASAAGTVTWLAAAVKSNGDALVLYNVGATVYSAKRVSGAWGSPAAWSNSVASVLGLACHYQGDWNAAVAGTNSAGDALAWTAIFGDGFLQGANTWSALREVTRASSGASVTFRAPFLGRPDVYRLTFAEKYTGSVAYARSYHSYSPATADYSANLWREPVPFDVASDYGLAMARSTAAAWLTTPAGVWRADRAVQSLDVTADVLEATMREEPFGGRLHLVLRNDGGQYSAPPTPIAIGAEVRVSPGYVTAAGPQTADGPAYWIEAIERRTGGGEAAIVLTASDGWGLLEAWRARRQYTWAAGEKNVFGILQLLCARAGLEFGGSGSSSEAAGLFPAFTVHPGESAATAARRLLAMVPDILFFRGEFALLKEPLASQATDYAYGVAHPIAAGRYADERAAANRVQVFGKTVFGERFDWPGVAASYDRLTQVLDANLTTQTQVEERADALLRHAALDAAGGEITVRANCGQELYDVVEVTDPGAGLAAAKRRVLALDLRYATGEKAAYEQRIRLGGL